MKVKNDEHHWQIQPYGIPPPPYAPEYEQINPENPLPPLNRPTSRVWVRKSKGGKPLGILAIVIAGIAAMTIFVPALFIFSIPLATIALILGVVSLVLSRGGRAPLVFGIIGAALAAGVLTLSVIILIAAVTAIYDDPSIHDVVNMLFEHA